MDGQLVTVVGSMAVVVPVLVGVAFYAGFYFGKKKGRKLDLNTNLEEFNRGWRSAMAHRKDGDGA